jgi:hypothetical protein
MGDKIHKVTLNQTCLPDGRNKKYNFGGESFWKITALGIIIKLLMWIQYEEKSL